MGLRLISYGGGVQSTALVVLAGTGRIDFPVAVFANVGDRAERTETIDYVARHAMPWAEAHGVELVARRWVDRTGKERDLYDDLMRDDVRDVPIPVYMEGGAPGRRKCTDRYKIAVVGREARGRGASPEAPATVAVGISVDEMERASNRRSAEWEQPVYPLLELGLTRADCETVIRDAGLPVPPKSACWFCPFQSPQRWAERRRDDPERFWQGVQLEQRINETRAKIGKDAVYLTRTKRPLEDLTEAQDTLPGMGAEGCDDGYCWT